MLVWEALALNGLRRLNLLEQKIIAVDVNDDKLGLARQLGATHTVNAKDKDHLEQIKDITAGGVDYAFEFAGSVAATETCYKSIKMGGQVIMA